MAILAELALKRCFWLFLPLLQDLLPPPVNRLNWRRSRGAAPALALAFPEDVESLAVVVGGKNPSVTTSLLRSRIDSKGGLGLLNWFSPALPVGLQFRGRRGARLANVELRLKGYNALLMLMGALLSCVLDSVYE